MQFCFIANGDVLTLPITPASYDWTTGKNIETINISQLGDVYLPGNRSRHSGTIECLLPSQDYPFNQSGTLQRQPIQMLEVSKLGIWTLTRMV